jgi:ribosomal protein S12 methylthiotransferase accessory factor
MSKEMSIRRPRDILSPIDERTGLIRWLVDLPIDPGAPTIFNCSAQMATVERYAHIHFHTESGGAGLTRRAARTAALGEAMERYCAGMYSPEHLRFGTAEELSATYPVAHPDSFALFHPDQRVSYPPFTTEVPLAWVWGYSLARHAPLLAPACLVYMPYDPPFRERGERIVAGAVSTGLACGRSLEEAVLRGVYETVERDAFVITWLNRLPMPQVDLTRSEGLSRLYHERLRRNRLEYFLIDITTDIPIPTLFCVLIDRAMSPPMVTVGGASHLDPMKAATKALLEAVQTREWAKYLGREKPTPPLPGDVKTFEEHVVLYAYGDMLSEVDFLIRNEPRCTIDQHPNRASGDPKSDLATTVNLLSGRGQEVIALDLTTMDVEQCGYRVTKVLIPGLQPLDGDYSQRFLGGSRLYEVPALLGFRSGPSSIVDVNPAPHPYP